jgi:hypothetical protein
MNRKRRMTRKDDDYKKYEAKLAMKISRTDINKIMCLLTYNEDAYYEFKKKNRGQFLRHIVEDKIVKNGFTDYQQIKASCPIGMKLHDYLYQLVK